MSTLDRGVRLVVVQFSFSNPDMIPDSVRYLGSETPKQYEKRMSHQSGVQEMDSGEKKRCSLAEFCDDLESSGYTLADGRCKECIDPNDRRHQRTYFAVRFLFVRQDLFAASEKFEEVRDSVSSDLRFICESSIWRTRVYRNPFCNGEEASGEHVLSVNLMARQPLLEPDGKPIRAWKKDERGERVGDAPVPLAPDCHLRIRDGVIEFSAD